MYDYFPNSFDNRQNEMKWESKGVDNKWKTSVKCSKLTFLSSSPAVSLSSSPNRTRVEIEESKVFHFISSSMKLFLLQLLLFLLDMIQFRFRLGCFYNGTLSTQFPFHWIYWSSLSVLIIHRIILQRLFCSWPILCMCHKLTGINFIFRMKPIFSDFWSHKKALCRKAIQVRFMASNFAHSFPLILTPSLFPSWTCWENKQETQKEVAINQ